MFASEVGLAECSATELATMQAISQQGLFLTCCRAGRIGTNLNVCFGVHDTRIFLLAVIYLGQDYLVFRDRVAALTNHFDALVRSAIHSSRDVTGVFTGRSRNSPQP